MRADLLPDSTRSIMAILAAGLDRISQQLLIHKQAWMWVASFRLLLMTLEMVIEFVQPSVIKAAPEPELIDPDEKCVYHAEVGSQVDDNRSKEIMIKTKEFIDRWRSTSIGTTLRLPIKPKELVTGCQHWGMILKVLTVT